MAAKRCIAVFEHDNGLPRDATVMTFHFENGIGGAYTAAEIGIDVVNMFTTALPSGRKLGSWIGPSHDSIYAKVYDVNDFIDSNGRLRSASGPPEFVSSTITLGTKLTDIALPAEVAVCLSTRCTTEPMVPRQQRTGRFYMGPLCTQAMEGTTGAVARPAATLLTDLRDAANKLHDDAITHGGTWVVYSRPFGGRAETPRPGRPSLPELEPRGAATYPIDQVWTDDAFDTQRRRGERATGKTTLAV